MTILPTGWHCGYFGECGDVVNRDSTIPTTTEVSIRWINDKHFYRDERFFTGGRWDSTA